MSVSKLTLVKLGSEISTAGLKPLHPQVESDSTPGVATAATLTQKAAPVLDLEKSSEDGDEGGGGRHFHLRVLTVNTLTPEAATVLDLEKSSIDDNGGGVKRFHPLGIVEISYILLHGWRQI